MILRSIIFLLFTCVCFNTHAQVNYVLNPSFEQYSSCPSNIDQIFLANYWSAIDSSATYLHPYDGQPEYCNVCANVASDVGVPLSFYYNHYPRTGNGMAQVIVYFDESYPNEFVQRDYLQGRLYKPLTSGKSYCVTFYVTLTQFSEYASNQVGAYLDNGMIDTTKRPSLPQTEYTPQIIETSIIDDTLNWIKVQGSFTATGNEKYITIGNFSDKAHTSAVALPYSASNFTWYLVDDVSVIDAAQKANAGPDKLLSKGDSVYIGTSDEGMPCTWYVLGNTTPIGYSGGIWVKPASTTSYVIEMDLCGNVTYDTMKVVVAPAGIGNVQMQKHANAQIFPNPANDEMTIEDAANGTMCVYNLMGQQVFAAAIVSEKQILRISDLALGTYIVQITFDDGSRQSMRLVKG